MQVTGPKGKVENLLKVLQQSVSIPCAKHIIECLFLMMYITSFVGDAIRVWSLSTTQKSAYNEQGVENMPRDFDKHEDELLPFIQSCWQLAVG